MQGEAHYQSRMLLEEWEQEVHQKEMEQQVAFLLDCSSAQVAQRSSDCSLEQLELFLFLEPLEFDQVCLGSPQKHSGGLPKSHRSSEYPQRDILVAERLQQ